MGQMPSRTLTLDHPHLSADLGATPRRCRAVQHAVRIRNTVLIPILVRPDLRLLLIHCIARQILAQVQDNAHVAKISLASKQRA